MERLRAQWAAKVDADTDRRREMAKSFDWNKPGNSKFCRKRQYFQQYYKRTNRSTDEDTKKYPLHLAQYVGKINLDVLLEEARRCPQALRDKLYDQLRFAQDPKLYEEICKDRPRNMETNERTNITEDDIDKMASSNSFKGPIPRKLRRRLAKRFGKVFCRTQEAKKRRRQLYWPKQLNDEVEKWLGGTPECDIHEAIVHARHIAPGSYAICHDFTKGFMQIPLDEGVQPYYAFMYKGKVYYNMTAPMGAIWAPALMQTISEVLAYNEIAGVRTNVHIDNVRFHGTDPKAVQRASDEFVARCKRVNATLNDDPENQIHQRGVFCGVETDYEAGTHRVAQKTLDKLRNEAKWIDDDKATIEDIRVLFGLLHFCTRVLRIPPSEFFLQVKFQRRRMKELAKGNITESSPANVWPKAKPGLRNWVDLILANDWTKHHVDPDNVDLVIATDASVTGWGAVLYNEATGDVHATGGSWRKTYKSDDINELEVLAVSKAAEAFADVIHQQRVQSVVILLDNTASVHVLKKGSSRNFEMNEALRKALRSLPKEVSVRVAYITTETNKDFADPLSRGKSIDTSDPELASKLGQVGRRLARTALRVAVPRSGAIPSSCVGSSGC